MIDASGRTTQAISPDPCFTEEAGPTMPVGLPRTSRRARRHARQLLRSPVPEGTVRVLVLAAGPEDFTGVDLSSGAFTRIRRSAPGSAARSSLLGDDPVVRPLDLLEARLAADPERDDPAQPEAITVEGEPAVVGSLSGRKARHILDRLVYPGGRELLGFRGNSAPYWEFRGTHPSVAVVAPSAGPVLFKRQGDGSVWARFAWSRSDNWLPVEDEHARGALEATRRSRLSGNALADALGFKPRYLVATLSRSRSGYCYKTLASLLPRP
jgi:hypothetical protein